MLLPNPFRLPNIVLPTHMMNRSSLVVGSVLTVGIALASWGAVLHSGQPPAKGLPPAEIPSNLFQDKSPNGGSSAIQDDPLFQEIKSRAGNLPNLIDGQAAPGETSPAREPSGTLQSSNGNRRVYRAAEAMLRSARLLEGEIQQDAIENPESRRNELRQIVTRLREDARRVLQSMPPN